jgi:LysM repeat protein
MKAKFLSFFVLVSILLFSTNLNAENLYILFDEKCMDKLEYNQPDNGNYMVYRVNAGGGESIILEIGLESKIGQDELPRPFIGCYNGSFDMLLVNRVNARPEEIYMVVPKGRKYYVSPVKSATYYKNDGSEVTYVSPIYSFKFDLKDGVINENISYKNLKAKVYFDGRLENECSGVYLFRQTTRNASGAYASLKFVPEIGVVEETINITPGNPGQKVLTLARINDKRYDKYLEGLCVKASDQPITFDPSYKPDAYNVTPVRPTPNQPDMARKAPEEFSTKGAEKVARFHIVKKGETLYGIAKKYDITVSELKSWNDKKGNLIRAGEKYMVNAPQEEVAEAAPKETMTAKSGGIIWEAGKTTSSNAAWDRNASGQHVVASGETIASIAMKYGYTESRFRQMNNLRKNDYAKVGQVLVTSDCNCPTTSNTLTAKTVEGYPIVTGGNNLPYVDDPAEPTRTLEPAPYNTKVAAPTGYDAKPYDPFTANDASKSVKSPNTTVTNNVQHFDTPINTTSYYRSQPTTYGQPRIVTEEIAYPSVKAEDDFAPDEFTTKGVQGLESRMPASYNTPSNSKRIMHTVQEGDNLFRIARQYGVTVEHLRKVNNLELNEIIIPYQRIYIN